MKKTLLIFSMVLFFTACGNQTSGENSNIDQVQRQEEIKQEANKEGQEKQKHRQESEGMVLKKENSKKEEEKTYDDLSFIDCYRDILNSDLPINDRIEPRSNSHIVEYLNDDTYIDDQYFKTTYQHGSYYFNIIDHKDFKYPLLILKEKSKMFSFITIVQYLGNGKYNTMTSGGSEESLHPEKLYFDDEGNLYADSPVYGGIYAINKVNGRLMVNYAYTAEGKGPATKLYANYYEDPPIEEFDKYYPNGVDMLVRVLMYDDKKEDFAQEDLNHLTEKLTPVELFDLSIEKYNEVAKENFANKKNIGLVSKTRESSIEEKDAHAKMLNYIRENLNISQPEGKEEEVYIADYDNNGKLAAFVVAMNKDYKPELMFVDEDLNISKVKDLIDMKPYDDSVGYYKILNGGAFDAGNDQYLAIEENYGSSNSDCYVYSVANNKVYEPDISAKVSTFYKDGDTYSNKYYYHEYTEMGGSLQEGIENYKYYQVDRQFENMTKPRNEGVIDFSKETNEAPQKDEYIDPNADDANPAKDDYIDFNAPDNNSNEDEENKREEKQVSKEQNESSEEENSNLRDNVTKLKPEIKLLGPESGENGSKKIYLGVVNYNYYPKTARILVKCRDFTDIAKDGYLIHDADHEIGVKTNILVDLGLKDMGDDKTYTFTVQIVDGKVKSKEYTYFYNNKLNRQLKKFYSDSLIQNSKIGDKVDSLISKGKEMQGKYYFIDPISAIADYNAVETKLRNKWFAYADTISYNNILAKLEIAKDAKYTKSDLKSLYKASPVFRDITLAKKILDNIEVKSAVKDEVIDGKKYKLYYDITGTGMVLQIRGHIEDDDGKEILGESSLFATSKIDKNASRLNEEYMRNVGLQVLSSAMNLNEQVNGANKYTRKANDFSQSEELKLIDRSDLSSIIGKINKFYDYFDDKTLNSSKRRKLVSDTFDLSKKGIDFFSMCKSLNNIISANPKLVDSSGFVVEETSTFNADGVNINKYLKDCSVVYKYFTK